MDDSGFEEDESDGGDATAIRFEGAVAPYVVSFESASSRRRISDESCRMRNEEKYLMQSISMRCCSATLFSRLTLR